MSESILYRLSSLFSQQNSQNDLKDTFLLSCILALGVFGLYFMLTNPSDQDKLIKKDLISHFFSSSEKIPTIQDVKVMNIEN